MGGPITLIAIYLTIWWTVLFAVLPLGVQSRADAGLPTTARDPGAPVDPKLKKKFITTTWVSADRLRDPVAGDPLQADRPVAPARARTAEHSRCQDERAKAIRALRLRFCSESP